MTGELPDYDAALARAMERVQPLDGREIVALADAGDRVLATPIVADRDLPPFNRAQMDGYALRADEVGQRRSWPVVATIAAGACPDVDVPAGTCVAIATGAALPASVDTVIQHERSDRNDPVTFDVDQIAQGHAVHPRGSDAHCGQVIVPDGVVLLAHHVALAATVGVSDVSVRCRPRVTVLTSGDEVMPPTVTNLAAHHIRNSNAPLITDLIRRMGGDDRPPIHILDDRETTIRIFGDALAASDIVVTVGGVSAGDRDWFPAALEAHHADTSVTGAQIQPGKPIRVASTPAGTVVVCLPGNPVSALACACLFLWPIIRRQLGLDTALPWRDRTLTEAVRPNTRRTAFRPAIATGHAALTVPTWAGSGDLVHTSATHGLARLPREPDPLPAGTTVPFLPWPVRGG